MPGGVRHPRNRRLRVPRQDHHRPALLTELNEYIGKAEDESDVWLPARMAPLIRDALDGYERGRQSPGQHAFAELLAATDTSAIRLEMRDSYDQTEQGFAAWKATGDTGAYDWGDHLDSSAPRARAARRDKEGAAPAFKMGRHRGPGGPVCSSSRRWLPLTGAEPQVHCEPEPG
jgi:Family of unknown function (DUF6879)